ncbi:NADP oxidoreductase coenzyme F420-dependent domain protein [Pseudomonas fluorescens]|uniref:NADP oxidoreductase coenzyme F420-dependent domain protein n=1 Tax=Pseudomonas fluorescens TaxID=294 RepID=A0A0P8X3B6_PSEFL|nr:NADP oxidoreductase coenzyme F420-dependent domain protein [Pseudomonas fluorescens]
MFAKVLDCHPTLITGFDALDAGALVDSWRQQPGTPAYCTELTGDELTPALDAADEARAPHIRDVLMKAFMSAEAPLTHAKIVEKNRAVTAKPWL